MKPHERRHLIRRLQAPKPKKGERRKRIATHKAVLYSLSYYMELSKSDTCWPSQDTLAQDAGTSDREIRRAVADLVKAGIITTGWKHRTQRLYTWALTPDSLSGLTGQFVLRVVKRKTVVPTHIAGQPICNQCQRHPASAGEGTPCLACIRKRRAERNWVGTDLDAKPAEPDGIPF